MSNSAPLGPLRVPPVGSDPALARDPLLRALARRESEGSARVEELAGQLGVHPNTVRARLAELGAAGLVEVEEVRSGRRGRPARRYRLSPAGTTALRPSSAAAAEYHSLASVFADHLARTSGDPGGDAEEIGRHWGARLAGEVPEEGSPEEQASELLEGMGFSPRPDEDGVALRTCPLLDLVHEHPDVICRVHHGLVEGALRASRPDDEPPGVELVPFSEPGACRLRVGRAVSRR